jgi:membrane protease YdiL (CAAX protease family)
MSILLAVTAPSTSPAPPALLAPATAPADASALVLWIVVGWTAAGLLVASLLGAFRRKSIVGPERLAPAESAWDLLVIFIFVYFGGMLAAGMVIKALHLVPGARMILVEAGADLMMFILGVFLLRRLGAGAIKLLGLGPRQITAGVVTGATTMFVLYPIIQLTSECVVKVYEHYNLTKAKPHEILQLLGKSQDRRLTIFAILLACVIAPLAEELLFRGLLQTMLVRMFSMMFERRWARAMDNPNLSMDHQSSLVPLEYEPALVPIPSTNVGVRWAAVIVTSAIFAAIHIEPAFLAPLFVLALGLGYVYERTGNLWVTITAHALFNTAQILLYFAAGR